MDFFKNILQFYQNTPKKYKILLGLLILVNVMIKTYWLINAPIFVDEAWTFFNFTAKGFMASTTEYPAPNNHILHSVLTNISYYLPFSDTINLRMPNFLINLISVFAFFLAFAKLFNYKTGLIFAGIFSFSFPMLYYGYVARGYTMILLFYLIVFYAGIQIMQKNRQKSIQKYLVAISLASILGFYTMPSFLYPYATTLLFLLLIFVKEKDILSIKKLIFSALITGITVLLLYLPVFINSGIDAVIANRYVRRWGLLRIAKNLPHHFNESSIFLSYLPLFISLPLLGILIWKLKKISWNNEVKFAVFTIVITPFILLIHRVTPFPRTWIYLLIPVLFLLATYVNHSVKIYKNTQLMFVFTTVFAVAQVIYGSVRIKQIDHMSYEIDKVAQYIKNKDAKHIYIGKDAYLGTNLKYIFRDNQTIHFTENEAQIDIDKIKQYDFLILREDDAKDIGHLKNFDKRFTINETGWIHDIFERTK